MPLFFLPGNTEYGYTKSIYTLCFVSLLYILWGVEALSRRRWELDLTWGSFILVAFLAVSLLSLLGDTPMGVVVQSATLVLFFGLIGVLIANTITGVRELRVILAALLAGGLLNGLFGLLQYLGIVIGGAPGGSLGAVIATMGNPNYLGGFLAYLFFPCLALVVIARRHWERVLVFLGLGFVLAIALFVRQTGVRLGLAVAGLFLSFTAGYWQFLPKKKDLHWWGAWLGISLAAVGTVIGPLGLLGSMVYLGMGVVVCLWGKVLRRFRFAWILTAVAVLLAVLFLNPVTTPFSPVEKTWERNSGRIRAWDWWVGYFMWKDHPFTGVGLGGYKIHFVPYKPEFLSSPVGERYQFPIARAAQAHNEYVQVAAELGVFGVLVLLGGLGVLAFIWVRRIREMGERRRRLELAFLASGIVVLLVHALVSFPWHLPASSLVFVVALGTVLSPRYGRAGSFSIVLRGTGLRGIVTAVVFLGLGVSSLAVRDLMADRYLYYGRLSYYKGDVHTAYRLFQKAVSWDFFPRVTLYWLGLSQMELGLRDQALETLYRCLDRRYVHEALYLNIAALELERANSEAAEKIARELIATIPPQEMMDAAQYIVAIARYRAGDIAEAKKVLEEILERNPRFERGWALLGEIAQSTGDYEMARSYYEKALEVIENKIALGEERLQGRVTPKELGKLRTELRGLKAWQDLIKKRLANLP